MNTDHDTIVAPATAAGGAIAVIRISGGEAFAVCDRIFRGRRPLAEADGYTVHYGTIAEGDRVIDDVLAAVFRAPHSYTGENSVEISCHGSSYIVSEILRLLTAAGGRMAQPGEFIPRKINGKYVMFSRPSDSGHTPFGDMYLSQSPDMKYWGEHRHVMAPMKGWESLKIGAGPIPIETSEGWLVFYHGVLQSCNGYVYSFSAAILDIDKPWKVKYRCAEYLLNPREYYECVGDVQNVTFPCAALCDADTGRIAIYYGCADTCVSMAFTTVDEVVDYVKKHSSV